jgi:hypothetical protein
MVDQNVELEYYSSTGINTYLNPLQNDGCLIHALNVTTSPMGAKTKRSGYTAFLNNPDSSQVNSLFNFENVGNDPTQNYLYRASGSTLYYYPQDATLTWHAMGNGTITNNAHFGKATLDNVMIGGDGVLPTRHTTDGTSFTNTTLAPPGEFFEQYQNRIYIGGTSSTLFNSTTNDATNWNTSGTSDSNSLEIPGAGKMGKIFTCANQLICTKSSGAIQKWDGYSLIDMSTRYGPSSPYSVSGVEGYKFYVNQMGVYGFGGSMPTILSNTIERQFYNVQNSGVAGTAFATIPAVAHRYDYLAAVGDVTDDFTQRTISNAIIKFDYKKNDFLNWSFANNPTSWLSYTDTTGTKQLIFGDTNGQVYQMDNSMTDNGSTIACELVFFFTFKMAHIEKQWRWWRGFFNPGCEAKVQVAYSNVFDYQSLQWEEIGDCSSGFIEYRFPPGARSRFLFLRIYESSTNSRMTYYGCEMSAIPNPVL